MLIVKGLYYADDRVWARVEKTESTVVVVVGITPDWEAWGEEPLSSGVSPENGATVSTNIECGTVWKGSVEVGLFSPVEGVISEVNPMFTEVEADFFYNPVSGELGLVNTDPYDKGWLFKVRPTNLKQDLKRLMTAVEYAENYLDVDDIVDPE